MTRDQYIDRVQKLQDLFDKECMLYDLGVDVNELTSPVVEEYRKMIEEATNDEPNEAYGSELAYFCYDRDFWRRALLCGHRKGILYNKCWYFV